MNFIFLFLLAIIVGGLWVASDCQHSLPYGDKIGVGKYSEKICKCPEGKEKVNGKCIVLHNSTMTSCTAYDHCSSPEQCVRQSNGSFACQYVQTGCYQYMDVGQIVKEKCY